MKLADFICFNAIVPELESKDRDGVITELVSALDKAGRLGKRNRKKITMEVIKREKEASTGMGKGVAVPHVKHQAVKDVVAAIGQSGAGIDFSALDKQPVYSVILLVSPADDPGKHLQAMESIFQHLQHGKFLRLLRQSTWVEHLEDLISEVDERPC